MILPLRAVCLVLSVRVTRCLNRADPMPIEFQPEDDILLIRITGTFTRADAVGTQAKASDMTKQRGIKKIFSQIN